MSFLDPSLRTAPGVDPSEQASKALEALVIKQLLQSSGVFHGSSSAGSGVRNDLFAEALADAVAQAGGVGLSGQLAEGLAACPALPPVRVGLRSVESLVGGKVTSGFGPRVDPINGEISNHTGIDVTAAEGTEIRAALPGVVRSARERGGYGFAVEVDHGAGVSTLYAHASQLLVHEGDRIAAGTPVALVGHTGRSTGPHLHFEVRVADTPRDPATALKSFAGRAD
jgi:murein DD-endopeptidase MepM/ murein hydrolase activator NlpD